MGLGNLNDLMISGTIQYGNIPLQRADKAAIEKVVHQYIVSCPRLDSHDEIQYWVSFRREEPDRPVNCRVEIFSRTSIWESSNAARDPMRAFERCMDELNAPMLKAS